MICRIIMNKKRNILVSGLLGVASALSGCDRGDYVTTYTIKQSGSSPARPVQLIMTEYDFNDDNSSVMVTESVADSEPNTPKYSYNLGRIRNGRWFIEGDSVENLHKKVTETAEKNDEAHREWDTKYNPNWISD
jgi:hypothetical protein